MRALTLGAIAVIALGACAERSQRLLFDGNYYPTRERGVDRDDRKLFETTVRRVDQGIEGAMAAALHGGTGYCIKNFGSSEIEWLSATDPATAVPTNGRLALRGRCVTW